MQAGVKSACRFDSTANAMYMVDAITVENNNKKKQIG